MFSTHLNRCSTPDLEVNVPKELCSKDFDGLSNYEYLNWKDQIEEFPEVFYISLTNDTSLHAVKYSSELHPVDPPQELDRSIRITYDDDVLYEEDAEQREKERILLRKFQLDIDTESDEDAETTPDEAVVTTSAVEAFFNVNLNILNFQESSESESDLSSERIERDAKTI